uniref:transposase n=1 Tax=Coprococcus catus TaxID=116085 RepID=UPI002F40703C
MPQVYKPEFKRKLVRLHLEEGRSYKSLTQEYGVSKSAISKWVELFSNAGKRLTGCWLQKQADRKCS